MVTEIRPPATSLFILLLRPPRLDKWDRRKRRFLRADCGPLDGSSLANVLQRPFAERIGIAFAALGKGNNLVGDGLPNAVITIADPQGNASNFEGNSEDAPRLVVETFAVQEWRDW